MSNRLLTDTTFRDFDLPDSILQGIEDAGFSACTAIQAETLPLALADRDVAGQAQTGTGKTAAFLVAAMTRLLRQPPAEERRTDQPRALVVAPTRELAIQIHRDAELLGRHTGLRFALAYGGTGYTEQRHILEAGTDILIGTPGRLIDYLKQRVFDLRAVEVVIIDEADRMFDLGFIRDLRFLLRRTPRPEHRLGLLFSATLSYRVTELAYEHMNNPQLVEIEPQQVTADKIRQRVYHPANDEKIPLLLGLLRRMDPRRIIIFVNTKRAAENVWGYLKGNGYECAQISGDIPQRKRQQLLAQFQNGELPILVATDVAARGLHVPEVSHVFNYDLPQDGEDYVHRVGRTARLGTEGDAISFACETYAFSLPEIESFIGMKIPPGTVSPDLLAAVDPPARGARREQRSARGSGHQRGRDQRGRRGKAGGNA